MYEMLQYRRSKNKSLMLDLRNLSNNSSILRDNILNYIGTTINNFINFDVSKN